MFKKRAFTLAEVLIAMTLVGAVAVMTIPNLQYNKTKKEYSARLRNFYARMENGVVEMELDKGSFRNLARPGGTGTSSDPTTGYKWYMENMDPYVGHKSVDSSRNSVYFNDGSSLMFNGGSCLDVTYDTNGRRAPNRAGRDQFRFMFCYTDDDREYWFGRKDIFFGTFGGGLATSSTTRSQMLEACRSGHGEITYPGVFCTRLLQFDNWEFKPDYPFKF